MPTDLQNDMKFFRCSIGKSDSYRLGGETYSPDEVFWGSVRLSVKAFIISSDSSSL